MEANAHSPASSASAATAAVSGRRGRPLTTGRYATRAELVDSVCGFYYHCSGMDQAKVARLTEVSAGAVRAILEGAEGAAWRAQVNNRCNE